MIMKFLLAGMKQCTIKELFNKQNFDLLTYRKWPVSHYNVCNDFYYLIQFLIRSLISFMVKLKKKTEASSFLLPSQLQHW